MVPMENRPLQTSLEGNFWSDSGFSPRTKISAIKSKIKNFKTIG
jgi:hypothetical protein